MIKQQSSIKLESVHVPANAHGVDQGGPEPVGGELHLAHDALDVAGSCHAKN